jgi:hypothetical protein
MIPPVLWCERPLSRELRGIRWDAKQWAGIRMKGGYGQWLRAMRDHLLLGYPDPITMIATRNPLLVAAFTIAASTSFLVSNGQWEHSALTEAFLAREMLRSSDGGYFMWYETTVEDITIEKFNAQLQPLWAKTVSLPGEWLTTNGSAIHTSGGRTNDGGLVLVASIGYSQIAAMRIEDDGSVSWVKRIDIAPGVTDEFLGNGNWRNDVAVDADGSIFVKFMSTGLGTGAVIGLNNAGDPQWAVKDPAFNRRIAAILPDGAGGCYLTISPGTGDWYTIRVGHIANNGTFWTKRMTYPGVDIQSFSMKEALDGHLVLWGRAGQHAFALKLDADHDPEWFNVYIAYNGNYPCPAIQPGAFATSSDGTMAFTFNHNAMTGQFLTLLDADGHLASAHRLVTTVSGDESQTIQIRNLIALGNELFMPADMWREGILTTSWRSLAITTPFVVSGLCSFEDFAMSELNIPTSELDVQMDTVLVSLPTPMATTLDHAVNDAIPHMFEKLCTTVGTNELQGTGHDPVLLNNIIPRNGILAFRPGLTGQAQAFDVHGRHLRSWAIRAGIAGGADLDLASGTYILRYTDTSQGWVAQERFVVE